MDQEGFWEMQSRETETDGDCDTDLLFLLYLVNYWTFTKLEKDKKMIEKNK